MKQVVEININKNSNIIMDIIYTHRQDIYFMV